ncbi:MAG TPA: hypothetical protein VMN60_00360 [Longimicrobiales bacterium]|nr:hypothetical protein [Longimicrobiales bacterium]
MMARCGRLAACLFLLCAAPLAAQQAVPPPAPAVTPAAPPPVQPGAAFLASALLPGAAQYLASDERWLPYVATEVWALASYVQQRRSAHSLEQRYRDLAWQVARRVSVGERRDSVFEYYEAMTHHAASGAFDVDKLTAGVQPEPQAGTFNGDLWALARDLHFPGGRDFPPGTPAYDAALAYYLARAIPEQYAWAWGGSSLEQQIFSDIIVQSDAAARAAARYIGVILANHMVSAVDALVTARLRELGAGAFRIEGRPVPGSRGGRWEQSVRIRF